MKQNLHICGQSCDRFDLMKYIQEDSALVSDELCFVTGRANISSFVSVSGKSVLCNYGRGAEVMTSGHKKVRLAKQLR